MATELNSYPFPSDELVVWAGDPVIGIRLPADRPWYHAAPPTYSTDTWEYLCRCRKEPVRVVRYPCEEMRGSIFLGQCHRCEAIIWAYREAGTLETDSGDGNTD